ncbi:MAG: hypothetical protein ACP5HI_08170, partial [Caldimicrobium sp.]
MILEEKKNELLNSLKEEKIIKVVGPPRSGKTTFVELVKKEEKLERFEFREAIIGFENEAEELKGRIEKFLDSLREAIHAGQKRIELEKLDGFKFWISPEDLESRGCENAPYIEWEEGLKKSIKYCPPGILIRLVKEGKDNKYIEEQIERYKKLSKDFGLKEEFGAATAAGMAPEVLKRAVEGYLDQIKSIALGLSGLLAGGIAGAVLGVFITLFLSRGEKDYLKKLVEIGKEWKNLDDEMKQIISARLAYAMGVKNPDDIRDLYEALNNIFGTSEDGLRKSLDVVRSQIDKLSGEIEEIRSEMIRAEGLRPLDSDDKLKNYYGVNMEPLEIHEVLKAYRGPNFREEKIKRAGLAKEIAGWDPSSGPLIYAIVGPSGVGKSWLTYRIVKDALATNTEKKAYSIHNIEKFDYPNEKCVLLMDDSMVTASELEEAYKLLTQAVREEQENITGPIIITTTTDEWKRIYERALTELQFNEEKEKLLKTRTVKIEVGAVSEEEMLKVLNQLLGDRIKVPEDLKRKIVERAGGIPIILRYFLEGKNEIEEKDLGEIEKDPKAYALKKIMHFYLFDCRILSETDQSKEDFLQILALLEAILDASEIAAGQIDMEALKIVFGSKYKELEIAKALNALFEEQKQLGIRQAQIGTVELDENGFVARFPLFKTDPISGEIIPIHPSVKAGFDRLVNAVFNNEEEIDNNCIKNLHNQLFDENEYNKNAQAILEELKNIPDNYSK